MKREKHMNTKKIKILQICLILFTSLFLFQSNSLGCGKPKITVEVDKPQHRIPSTLFGIFFEDINLSADGGLYPELVRNRSFEDADTLQFWKFGNTDGRTTASVITADVQAKPPVPPLNPFNRKSLYIKANGSFTLKNEGYWGMNIVQGHNYILKMAVRSPDGFASSLKIRIVGTGQKELASGEIKGFDHSWKYYTLQLKASGSDPKAYLEISGNGVGQLYLDMVSLMPEKTWKNHGLRIDLAEALETLHPKFIRFPGGCWVEGDDFLHMNHWKHTIGNIDTRTSLWNIWGYNATNSLGFHEYLQLAEDLGAEPVFCINAGISHKEIVPMDQMGQWVQDALDAIEYANGPVHSVWGSLRAKNGHPEPFNLKYIEIGNENGQEPYAERWALFVNAIREKYPDIIIIANEWAGSHPQNPQPDIVDEHYYSNPDWFIYNANKYDSYDRKGPKIFVGEYAVTQNTGNGNLRGAIGEAAWMIGLERNSDVVVMASYAPLFCNASHKAWPVNLINFDSYRWYGIPSYYVQQMFANNQGSVSLPVTIENVPTLEPPYSKGCIGVGTWNNAAEFKDLKVWSLDGKLLFETDFSDIDNWRKTGDGEWSVQNGVLRQSAIAPQVTAFTGDTNWTDCTITLKARKLFGENGFQIYFRNRNNRERLRWDLGGWGNSVHYMEIGLLSKSISGKIEAGRWYDVKIELHGNTAKGYLDGTLVQELTEPSANVKSLCSSASLDEYSGDIILKIVNTAFYPIKTQIELKGLEKISGTGKVIVLTSQSPLDENTLEEPKKVSPKKETIKITGLTFSQTFPGNSLSVIRILTANEKKK